MYVYNHTIYNKQKMSKKYRPCANPVNVTYPATANTKLRTAAEAIEM